MLALTGSRYYNVTAVLSRKPEPRLAEMATDKLANHVSLYLVPQYQRAMKGITAEKLLSKKVPIQGCC